MMKLYYSDILSARRACAVARYLNAQHFTRASGALYFENIVKKRFGIGVPDPAVVNEALSEFRRYALVQAHL